LNRGELYRVQHPSALDPRRQRVFVVVSRQDPAHFRAMLDGCWLALREGGLFFCRLASTIGMPGRFRPLGDGRFVLPDGSRRFLVDEAMLLELTAGLGAELMDPIKTTVVQDQRAMTTWVLRKKGRGTE
jgi:tellurite methyltransferase